MRKDIKKSSYYVWFLGAQEAKGLRGSEYIVPVIRNLVEREREVEPFKVTLQASYKGLKIIQNVPASTTVQELPNKHLSKSAGKTEVVKHFIPHHAVTCVFREEDIVATILLLYNPFTKCPVHVQAYRCDSVETAIILSSQLQTLIDRPENQKKLSEIETRLKAKGLLSGNASGSGREGPKRTLFSDTRSSSTRESESSSGSVSDKSGNQDRIASLYDSLAAELREKLATGPQPQAPILLPPRDYDTVHRQKGDLSNIDRRRCLNTNVVGVNVLKNSRNSGSAAGNKETPSRLRGKVGSSGGSSGIGSDHAPSPEQEQDSRFLEEQSSSDEEWNIEASKDPLLLANSQKSWCSGEVSLPRARRGINGSVESKPSPPSGPSPVSSTAVGAYRRRPSPTRGESPSKCKTENIEEPPVPSQRWKRSAEERQRTPSPAQRSAASVNNGLSPRERFHDAKEKFLLLERDEQERIMKLKIDRRRAPEQITAARPQLTRSWSQGRSSVDEQTEPVHLMYSLHEDPEFKPKEEHKQSRISNSKSNHAVRRNRSQEDEIRSNLSTDREFPTQREDNLMEHLEKNKLSSHHQGRQNYSDDHGKMHHMYGLPPRKEMNDQRGYIVRSQQHSPYHHYPKDIIEELGARSQGRSPEYMEHDINVIPLERYRSPPRMEVSPTAAPRHHFPLPSNEMDELRDMKNIRSSETQHYPRHTYEQSDKKRRSVYEAMEDERKRNSIELAKEFKRRSYQDQHGNFDVSNAPNYSDMDYDRYLNSRENSKKQTGEEMSGRFRHSFVEPINHSHDHLPRPGSSIPATRVGIAAIHPY